MILKSEKEKKENAVMRRDDKSKRARSTRMDRGDDDCHVSGKKCFEKFL